MGSVWSFGDVTATGLGGVWYSETGCGCVDGSVRAAWVFLPPRFVYHVGRMQRTSFMNRKARFCVGVLLPFYVYLPYWTRSLSAGMECRN